MRHKNTNNTSTEMEKDVESEAKQITTTDGYEFGVRELSQGNCNVWQLELVLSKTKERRAKKYKLSSNQKQEIDKHISGLLQVNIKNLALWCGTVSYDCVNGVKIAYDRGHAKYDEIIKYLEQYVLENYPDLIEELKK